MITFGTYSLTFKSYTAKDFDNQDFDANAKIEVRQKCFHICWIPIFSLGVEYTLYKDGNRFELPYQYHRYILPYEKKHKTQWYSFLGPIILLVVGYVAMGVTAKEEYDYFLTRENYYKNFYIERDSMLQKISDPSTNDYYLLEDLQNYKKYLLKVEDISEDSIYFLLVPKSSYHDSIKRNYDYYLEKNNEEYLFCLATIDELKSAVKEEYYENFEGAALLNILQDSKFVIRKIERHKE